MTVGGLVKYKIDFLMKLKNFQQNYVEVHHLGGAAHHGVHHRHHGSAPVFVVFRKGTDG